MTLKTSVRDGQREWYLKPVLLRDGQREWHLKSVLVRDGQREWHFKPVSVTDGQTEWHLKPVCSTPPHSTWDLHVCTCITPPQRTINARKKPNPKQGMCLPDPGDAPTLPEWRCFPAGSASWRPFPACGGWRGCALSSCRGSSEGTSDSLCTCHSPSQHKQ